MRGGLQNFEAGIPAQRQLGTRRAVSIDDEIDILAPSRSSTRLGRVSLPPASVCDPTLRARRARARRRAGLPPAVPRTIDTQQLARAGDRDAQVFSAAIISYTLTVDRSPWRRRLRLVEQITLLLEADVLSSQRPQILVLCRDEPLVAVLVAIHRSCLTQLRSDRSVIPGASETSSTDRADPTFATASRGKLMAGTGGHDFGPSFRGLRMQALRRLQTGGPPMLDTTQVSSAPGGRSTTEWSRVARRPGFARLCVPMHNCRVPTSTKRTHQ